MDYKKAYETALARANAAVRNGMVSQNFVNDIFKIESEDERIRKALIAFISDAKQSIEIQERDSDKWQIEQLKGFLSWLEKQGEQKPAEWSKEDEDMLACCEIAIVFFKNLGKNSSGHPRPNHFDLDEKIYPERVIEWLNSLKERFTGNRVKNK